MRQKMLEESPWQGIGASLGTPPIRAAGLNWRSPQPLATYRLAHEYTSTRHPLFGRSGVRREALRYIPGVAGMDWRDVLWSAVLPGAERLRGKELAGNWRPGPGIRDGAPGDPRDTVKAKLQDGTSGPLSANTFGQRLRMLRVFFERIIEWDWPGARPSTSSACATTTPKPKHWHNYAATSRTQARIFRPGSARPSTGLPTSSLADTSTAQAERPSQPRDGDSSAGRPDLTGSSSTPTSHQETQPDQHRDTSARRRDDR
jgi:hypothetical protein